MQIVLAILNVVLIVGFYLYRRSVKKCAYKIEAAHADRIMKVSQNSFREGWKAGENWGRRSEAMSRMNRSKDAVD